MSFMVRQYVRQIAEGLNKVAAGKLIEGAPKALLGLGILTLVEGFLSELSQVPRFRVLCGCALRHQMSRDDIEQEHTPQTLVKTHLSSCQDCNGVFQDLRLIVQTAAALRSDNDIAYPDEEVLWQRVSARRIIH